MTKQIEPTVFGYEWETIRAMQQGVNVSKSIPPSRGMITPSRFEKLEWARMAQDAYAKDMNDIGHRFSGAASMRDGERLTCAGFDSLQEVYRAWLIGGFAI